MAVGNKPVFGYFWMFVVIPSLVTPTRVERISMKEGAIVQVIGAVVAISHDKGAAQRA